MINVEFITGLNYGDEGKGRISALRATQYDVDDTISVLMSGSSQRGHTMVDENGNRHVFHHFGSATMYDYHNYIDQLFLSNPMTFREEWEELGSINITPIVYLNQFSTLVLPAHIICDQCYTEICRALDSVMNSSCGCGVWFTMQYKIVDDNTVNVYYAKNKDNFDKIKKHFMNAEWFASAMVYALGDMVYGIDLMSDNRTSGIMQYYYELLMYDNIWNNYYDDLIFMTEHCTLINSMAELRCNGYNNYIVELSQGLSLDREYCADSHITTLPVNPSYYKMIIDDGLVQGRLVCYHLNFVTRWYLTRHGYNYDSTQKLIHDWREIFPDAKIEDNTNIFNEWQGNINYGYLNIARAMRRMSNEVEVFGAYGEIRCYVTCFDQVGYCVRTFDEQDDDVVYTECTPSEFLKVINYKCKDIDSSCDVYVCCGEQPENVILLRRKIKPAFRYLESETCHHHNVRVYGFVDDENVRLRGVVDVNADTLYDGVAIPLNIPSDYHTTYYSSDCVTRLANTINSTTAYNTTEGTVSYYR